MFFSVLIPAYNAEKYIESAIRSVVSQSCEDFELIILDDGSTDSTWKIIENFDYEGCRVRCYHQENTGVLIARRKLAEKAKGDFLAFLDADDWFSEGALETIKEFILKSDVDMVLLDLQKTGNRDAERFTLPLTDGSVYERANKEEILKYFLMTKYMNGIVQKIAKKTCYDLEADYTDAAGMRVGEDIYQSFPIMDRAEKIGYLKSTLYYYRKNEGSATATVRARDIDDCFRLYRREDEYLARWKLTDEVITSEIANRRVRRLCGFLTVRAKSKTGGSYRDFVRLVRSYSLEPVFVNAAKQCARSEIAPVYRLDILLMRFRFWLGLYILHKYII